jgi:predicted RND superfamily exporter protein
VGFDIQSTGEFAQMVSRDTAVYGPFALTVLCVVLMLMSRKTIYPWLISIFTLVLPLLIWVLNAGLF